MLLCIQAAVHFFGLFPGIDTSWGLSTSTEADPIMYGADGSIADGDFVGYYSHQADFFFQVVFVATAMSIVSGAVAGRMKLLPFFLFAVVLTGFIYPTQGFWNWGMDLKEWVFHTPTTLVQVLCTYVVQQRL